MIFRVNVSLKIPEACHIFSGLYIYSLFLNRNICQRDSSIEGEKIKTSEKYSHR